MTSRSLAVVIPCFNEEGNLRETHRRVSGSVAQVTERYEIVYVDDGSRDDTPNILRQIQAEDPHVRVVFLARNFGHQHAVTAGLGPAGSQGVGIMGGGPPDPPQGCADNV